MIDERLPVQRAELHVNFSLPMFIRAPGYSVDSITLLILPDIFKLFSAEARVVVQFSTLIFPALHPNSANGEMSPSA